MELEIKMAGKQKLELTWIGKDKVTKLEPRILIEDADLSFHANHRFSDDDIYDNKLIFGDNLLALKAIEQEYADKVRAIFIDPPYNTGAAFEQFGYDDGIEHSIWLSLMRDRLKLLKTLMSKDGSIWITIDDNEAHYLKVLCDEIFGRTNFVANIVWQKRIQPDMRATIGAGHDHILVYAKDIGVFKSKLKMLPTSKEQLARYKNPDNDPRGPWVSADFMAKGYRPNQMYEIKTPSGKVLTPRAGSCWRNVEPVYRQLVSEGRIWFGKDGDSVPRKKTYLNESDGIATWTWWSNSEVGHNQEAKKEINALFGVENAFETPKPERLLSRIIHLASDEGDIVLDSFGGSGTTAAVAHKMKRRWVTIELENHCHTHIIPRLKKVIDGVDEGGVTEDFEWKGGGGFRYYKLAPSLLEKDKWGNWVINKEYDANMLAAAVCKHEGFAYSPSDSDWWAHGYSTETDFIYVTTQTLTEDQLVALSEEVGTDRTLLVCCAAYKASAAMLNDKLTNLTVKKMPNTLLSKCEWGKDDYSLNITKLPVAELEDDVAPALKKKSADKEADLFGDAE
jgi:adenine-specific DNA-methyltransferase